MVHVEGDELELHGAVDRKHQPVDGDLAFGIDVLPVELVALHLDDELVRALAARRLDRRGSREDDRCDADEDDRDERPDDLEARVSVDLRPLSTSAVERRRRKRMTKRTRAVSTATKTTAQMAKTNQ